MGPLLLKYEFLPGGLSSPAFKCGFLAYWDRMFSHLLSALNFSCQRVMGPLNLYLSSIQSVWNIIRIYKQYKSVYCVSPCSETILHLLKAKTILLLSPCMAYSGKLNGEWINVISTLASGESLQLQRKLLVLQAWSYRSTVECTGRVLEQLRSLEKQLKVWLGSRGLW